MDAHQRVCLYIIQHLQKKLKVYQKPRLWASHDRALCASRWVLSQCCWKWTFWSLLCIPNMPYINFDYWEFSIETMKYTGQKTKWERIEADLNSTTDKMRIMVQRDTVPHQLPDENISIFVTKVLQGTFYTEDNNSFIRAPSSVAQLTEIAVESFWRPLIINWVPV